MALLEGHGRRETDEGNWIQIQVTTLKSRVLVVCGQQVAHFPVF